MKLKAILAGAAASAVVALATPQTAGAADALPSEAQNFVKVCKAQMEKNMSKQSAQMKAMGDDAYKRIMNAARGMCGCIAGEVHKSDKITAEDKKKVWAVRDFSPKSKPKMSAASEAGFKAVGEKCAGKMMKVMMAVMKEFRDKMKQNQ